MVRCLSIKNLVECLEPFKLAVEALHRREASLLTAETTLKFIFEKLSKQSSYLSISEALRVRVRERRSIVMTGILVYLNNPKKYDQNIRQADETFPMPKKNVIRQEMKTLNRVISEVLEGETEEVLGVENDGVNFENDSLQTQPTLSLREELEK
uniref:Uncharacterized protein n=1 Tax=Clastoptera arizonana TaxID=38151 RepID=A0A1B6DKP9_9HEMI